MQFVEFLMLLLLAMPWILTACWFTFTRRRNPTLLAVTTAPWFLAMFALIGFHVIAQTDIKPPTPDPAFYQKGVGYGYLAVTYTGLAVALTSNLLCAAIYALYTLIHRAFHHHHQHTKST